MLGYFDRKIPCVIDGGECEIGVASTILDVTGEKIKVLRLGGLLPEEIKNKTGIEVIL